MRIGGEVLDCFLLPVALINIVFLGISPQIANRSAWAIPHLTSIRLRCILHILIMQILEVSAKQRLFLCLLVEQAIIHV